MAVNTLGVLNGKTVTAIAAGEFHTCAVADGKAYCWGWNPSGQLGNDSTADSHVPVAVKPTPVCLPAGRSPRSPPAAITRVRWPTARRTAGA